MARTREPWPASLALAAWHGCAGFARRRRGHIQTMHDAHRCDRRGMTEDAESVRPLVRTASCWLRAKGFDPTNAGALSCDAGSATQPEGAAARRRNRGSFLLEGTTSRLSLVQRLRGTSDAPSGTHSGTSHIGGPTCHEFCSIRGRALLRGATPGAGEKAAAQAYRGNLTGSGNAEGAPARRMQRM